MNIIEYKIITASNPESLMKKINDLIVEEWIPQGGIAYCQDTQTWENERKGYQESNTDEIYLQAMIRK